MVIALLSPALPTLDMDRLSSAHLVTTQMGIIKGYEGSLSLCMLVLRLSVQKVPKISLDYLLFKDGYQQNYKRGASQGPRGVSRGSTQAMRS